MAQSSLMAWLTKPATIVSPSQEKLQSSPPDDMSTRPKLDEENRKPLFHRSTTVDELHDLKASSPKQALLPNVEIRSCTKEDIKSVKHLTSLILPITYPDKFYRETLEDEIISNITLVAVWHDNVSLEGKEKGRLVGVIRCRLLADSPSPVQAPKGSGPLLYLSTLLLLSPYRNYGIATQMLDILTRRAINTYGISSVGAHVWEANEEGLEWYRRRGFVETAREKDYYRRLNPKGAVIMERKVGVMDLIA
nr:isoform 2 of n-alpha-acetyltransferase 50 [Quercus suber]